MSYPKIKSLAPAGEHFDESAIVNEGGFLSVAHLGTIENHLVDNAAAYATLEQQFNEATASATTLQTTIDGLNTQISGLNDTAIASATTINTQANRITELEAQVVALGGQSSGSGTVLVTKKDENVTETPVNSAVLPFDSPDRPENQAAMRRGISLKPKNETK